ncbi:guanylate kinase [Luteibaculum oceani]|uniref:Guanylate kinase n=1 Tax=Luteibaculum oceani TaxID=1294296 RepID=A0A5C6VIJ4_9FLAO|nr:guanylate kinase [Luteibaculum oceani]TXC85203.1 guanylate kinase [Luteibaculum oceani]
MDKKCIIFSAPSGAGKTTIVRYLIGRFSERMSFSISATNREPRANETHGEDYYFLSTEEFEEKIKNDEFIEWEEVYAGTYYGTLKAEIDRIWEAGKCVIFDVDVKGGVNLKKYFGDQAKSFFVMPPSVDALRERLLGRGTETQEKVEMRVAKAAQELEFHKKFDIVLLNDVLERALDEAEDHVSVFLK